MSTEDTAYPVEVDHTNALRGSNERVIHVLEDPNATAADVQNAINESDVRASQVAKDLSSNAVKGTRKVAI